MANARTQTAYVSPAVLQWARKRASMSRETLASKANVRIERIAAWEQGEQFPSMRQAEHIAGTLHVPFGYLFLPSPPEETIPLPDFRTLSDTPSSVPSPELLDAMNDAVVKQQWYREFSVDEGRKPLPFVGRFGLLDDPYAIASDLSRTVGLTDAVRDEASNWEDFLRTLIRMCESVGVLVMKSGIVGGNPHRKLSVEEFRGFTISDALAPLIFINGADSKAAQIFTLFHELAHVWINASGVSNERMDRTIMSPESQIEALCNRVAAEALVPEADLAWDRRTDIDQSLVLHSRRFKVSKLVILRRAFDLHYIEKAAFLDAYNRIEGQYRQQEEDQNADGGGNFFATLFTRNGRTFTNAVLGSLIEGKTLYREAAQMLNVKVPTINKIVGYIESRRT